MFKNIYLFCCAVVLATYEVLPVVRRIKLPDSDRTQIPCNGAQSSATDHQGIQCLSIFITSVFIPKYALFSFSWFGAFGVERENNILYSMMNCFSSHNIDFEINLYCNTIFTVVSYWMNSPLVIYVLHYWWIIF